MRSKNGKAREIWGRQFTIIKNGLDEREVFSFIGRLINQNNEYAEKLEHLDSLVMLSEGTVIEADKEAERIKIQAQDEANEQAQAITIHTEEEANAQAAKIIAAAEAKAKAQAERIIADAEATIQEKLSTAEQQDRNISKAAEERAREIKEKAQGEAQAIRQEAEQFVARSKKLAESEIRTKFDEIYREVFSVLDSPGTA